MAEDVAVAESTEEDASSAAEVDGSSSEDAVLDKYSKDVSSEKAPAEEAVVKEETTEEAKPVAETKPPETPVKEEDTFPDVSLDPKKYKEIWRRHPELRAEHYRLQQYQEAFPDLQAARELKDVFNSKDEALEARGIAEQALEYDQRFRRDPVAFATTLAQADPRAFLSFASRIGESVYSLNPQAYQAYFVDPVIQEFVSQFGTWGQQRGDEELMAALNIVVNRLQGGKQPAPQSAPDDPRFAQLADYQRREQEYKAQAAEQFYTSAGDSVRETVMREVGEIVERGGAAWSQGAKKTVLDSVVNEVGEALEKDTYLQHRIQYLSRSGRPDDPNTRDAVVSLMMGKARALLRNKAQEKISWMNRDVLAIQTAKNAQPRGRREPGEGGISSNTGPRQKPSRNEARGMTEDQILEAFSD